MWVAENQVLELPLLPPGICISRQLESAGYWTQALWYGTWTSQLCFNHSLAQMLALPWTLWKLLVLLNVYYVSDPGIQRKVRQKKKKIPAEEGKSLKGKTGKSTVTQHGKASRGMPRCWGRRAGKVYSVWSSPRTPKRPRLLSLQRDVQGMDGHGEQQDP